jgi:hypothetical protein
MELCDAAQTNQGLLEKQSRHHQQKRAVCEKAAAATAVAVRGYNIISLEEKLILARGTRRLLGRAHLPD